MKNFAVTACIHPDQHVLYKHGQDDKHLQKELLSVRLALRAVGKPIYCGPVCKSPLVIV